MKNIFKSFLILGCASLMAAGCDFLDPLPNGTYNEDNYQDYPTIVRGFIDKAYNLRPSTYYSTEYIGTDAGSDDAVYRSQTNNMREFSVGSTSITSNPFSTVWTRNYQAINYCNMFLKDNIGLNSRYLLDAESNALLAKCLQGDAFALRAWNYYELLKTFGGLGTDGKMLGVPILTEVSDADNLDPAAIYRATFDETVEQILRDCDSAEVYLPFNNRDYASDPTYVVPVIGSVRYRCFDSISLNGLRAMVYLMWASPAFNPEGDMTRYQKAAQYAAKVMKHKLEVESTFTGGFDPTQGFTWDNLNGPEVIHISTFSTSSMETNFYPYEFKGSANIVPTQDLVDAFPAANGYPISDPRSNYDVNNPYEGRDPRLYAAIFHNGSQALRNTNSEVMYTFESAAGGKDAPGRTETSPTSYYVKKFVYMGWNPFDENRMTGYEAIYFMRWEQMCLIFAEAASKVVSPTDRSTFGLSAKEALAYLRSRPTTEGKPGVGVVADPYLDECAGDPAKFEALVKNEWRITTCFEGKRFFNLRRWTANHSDLSAINVDVHGVSITGEPGAYTYTPTVIERKNYASLWRPLPYSEVRKCPNLVQNAGYENWK